MLSTYCDTLNALLLKNHFIMKIHNHTCIHNVDTPSVFSLFSRVISEMDADAGDAAPVHLLKTFTRLATFLGGEIRFGGNILRQIMTYLPWDRDIF